jgi:tryptophan 7-halogenase
MNITIIGSGSAGLLSALTLKHKMPNCIVTIIRDPNEPVIGVGEATVGSFMSMLETHLNLNMNDFIEKVKPVIKYGVLYEFGKKDFHYTFDNAFDFQSYNKPLPKGFDFEGGNYGNTEFSKLMMSKENGDYSGAFHVDNKLFLEYLENISIKKNIIFIDDKIESIKKKDDIIISLNDKYYADYFIDCSGFKSVLSDEKFISYSDSLVNDRSIFFRTKTKEKIKTYSHAITMNSGWLWVVDHTQGYSGNGYVYSSKYITDDDALKELEEKYKMKIKDYKVIPFKTGRKERHWVGNVITIGNADGFVEPLEATSLMVILKSIQLTSMIIKYGDKKGDLIIRYNQFINEYYDLIRDFILIHMCFNDKLDTVYWKDYLDRVDKLPKNSMGYNILDYYLKNNTHVLFTSKFFSDDNPFSLDGWFQMYRGLIPTEKDRKKILERLK